MAVAARDTSDKPTDSCVSHGQRQILPAELGAIAVISSSASRPRARGKGHGRDREIQGSNSLASMLEGRLSLLALSDENDG
jgi:hypothetical protein